MLSIVDTSPLTVGGRRMIAYELVLCRDITRGITSMINQWNTTSSHFPSLKLIMYPCTLILLDSKPSWCQSGQLAC